jgi:arsenate reductase (glutaredoxin)
MTTEAKTMIHLYGIANCDKVRAARRYLDQRAIDYRFCDLRAEPPGADQWATWLAALGSERLVNRRSTTWKQLSASQQAAVLAGDAVAVLQTHPTLMQRPLLVLGNQYHVGFAVPDYDLLLERHSL